MYKVLYIKDNDWILKPQINRQTSNNQKPLAKNSVILIMKKKMEL